MLPGLTPSVGQLGGAAALDVSFLTTSGDNTTQTTYTFSSLSFGTADGNRRILVAVTVVFNSSETATISSVTVGGISATSIVSTRSASGGASTFLEFFVASVPTGTTGSVVVNVTASATRACVALYRCVNMQGTAHATLADSTSPFTGAINVPSNGVVFAAAYDNGGGTSSFTGVTEQYDTTITAGRSYAGGFELLPAGETGRTVSNTLSSGSTVYANLAACSFARG